MDRKKIVHINDIINNYKILFIYNESTASGHKLYDVSCCTCGYIHKKITVQKLKMFSNDCSDHKTNDMLIRVENIEWSFKQLKQLYYSLIERCYNHNYRDYTFYGGNGIHICEDWLNNPKNFNDWAISAGYKNGLVLNRIDVSSDYTPQNCKWSTRQDVAKWKSTTTKITVRDITDSGKGWAKRLNLSDNAINKYKKVHGLDKTIQYIKDLLDGTIKYQKRISENQIEINGIIKNGVEWSKYLGLSLDYINNYIRKYGINETKIFIVKKINNKNDENIQNEKKEIVNTKTKVCEKNDNKEECLPLQNDMVLLRKKMYGKQISRLPRYFITSDFHIYDSETCKILNEYQSNSGHLFVSIVKDNKRTTAWIHKLVYEAYFGEIENGYVIHHIDENKTNNNINNLKKMTIEEHGRIHNIKYFDKMMICPQCGEEFLWTAKQQRKFYGNRNVHDTKTPFCSKTCIGKYGATIQHANKQKTPCKVNLYYNDKFIKSFDFFEDCSEYIQKETNSDKYTINRSIKSMLVGDKNNYKGYTTKYRNCSDKNKVCKINVYFNTKHIDTFDCIEKCSQLLQYEFALTKYKSIECVNSILNGKRKDYKGYVFKYHN